MFLSRLSVSSRFMLVLVIGLSAQAGISIQSMITLRNALYEDRAEEVKHLEEAAYTAVAGYYNLAAKGLMSDEAARDAAKNAVRSMHYDGTNYYFIWDQNGTGVVHGSVPAFEGVNFINSPEATKLPYVSDMVSKQVAIGHSTSGQGVAYFKMTKPGKSEPVNKVSFSHLFAPWGWNIGTGAYLDDIDAAFWDQARFNLMVSIGVMIFAAIGSYILGRDLSLALTRVSNRVSSVTDGDLNSEIPGTDRKDEVGVLARAVLLLRNTSGLAMDLEKRVKDRTKELRELQDNLENLVRQERLATIGQLTATVAHELRNPLSVIRNTAFAIKEAIKGMGLDLGRPLLRLDRNIDRCDRIIRDLLDYTRITKINRSRFEADSWLEEVLKEQTLPDGVVLRPEFGARGHQLSFDSERLRRVFINLIENAAQAMTDNAERHITVSTSASNDWYEVAVEDTGSGIPSDILPKVFEPLFSTKPFGTGLGLPTVRQIVEQHGGTVEITSHIGSGTRVIVRLPKHAEEIAA